jgi:hypothetical protein
MRFPMKLVLASLVVAGAMAVAPTLPASAAPVQGAQGATAAARPGGLAAAIVMKPGTHTVSETIPATSRQAAPSVPDQPCITSACPPVSVRVGPYNCAGFNGHIEWYMSQPPPHLNSFIINVWGILWDDCSPYGAPTTAALYINYKCFGCYPSPVNYLIKALYAPSSAYYYSTGVNSTSNTPSGYAPSNVKLTLCLSSPRGWACGKPQSF